MIRTVYTFAFALIFALAPISAHAAEKVLDIQKIESAKGIEAWLVSDSSAPVISISFSFDGGLSHDPDDKPGVGRLVSILLDEGAGDMDSQTFQRKLSTHAIHMGFTAGRDAFYGSIKTLSQNKDMAFDMLHMALTRARFDDDAIERMRNANTSQIQNDLGRPAWLVARTFNGMLFEGHPYERPGYGDLKSMHDITRDDLITYTKDQFAKNVLKVSIAGDITADDAKKALDQIFGDLPDTAKVVDIPDVALKHAGETILLQLDTPQTYIAVGAPGIDRHDPDWHAAMIMNYILGGGGFDARLMNEIRVKRGLTYGVYTSMIQMDYANLLQVNMSASNDKVAEALDVLKSEWTRMATDGVTADELKNAKSYLTGSLLLQLTSTDDISDAMNGIQRDKLGIDYINQRNQIIKSITTADIQRVAKKLLNAENLTTVLVGKPDNIKVDLLLDKAPAMRDIDITPETSDTQDTE